jgi:carbamoyltransferase
MRLLIDDRAIVGVARGRQEVGPRALGHRSLLGYPADLVMKSKLNRLKAREW